MSQKQKKNVIIAEMKASEKPGNAIEDRLINLGQYQQYAMRQTFGQELAPEKTFKDLIRFYQELNRAFDMGLDAEINALIEGCENLEGETMALIEENRDKSELHEKIKELLGRRCGGTVEPVLKDVRFNYEGKTRRFDEIVVTRGGVLVIEWRVPKHNIGIDEEGNYTEFFYKEVRVEKHSITDLVERGEKILSGVLKDLGYAGVPVQTIVVFGGKVAYVNLCKELTTMHISQLGKHLDEHCEREELCRETQRNIFNRLKEESDRTEPVEYNFYTSFVEAYADIRSKVECMLEKAKSKEE